MKPLLLALLPLAAVGQTQLSGRVLNSQTHQPVPYASVVVAGTTQGTTANAEGEFTLTVARLPANVLAFGLGYRRDSASIAQPERGLELRLLPAAVELPTVELPSYAAQLLMQAYRQVQRTRQPPDYGQAFYRQVTRNDGHPTEVLEAVWDVKVSSAGLEGSRLAQGRYGVRPALLNFENFALYTKLVGGFCGVSALDSTDSHAVVSPYPDRYFVLRYKGVTQSGSHRLAEVAYQSRPGIPTVQGSVFIDLASNQVLHARATRVAELTPSNPQVTFRNGSVTVEADFKPSPTGAQLNYIKAGLSLVATQKRKPDVPIHTESLTYLYDLKPLPTGLPYVGPEAVTNDLAAIKRKVYDPTYWRDNFVVKRTPLEDEIIGSFETKNAFGTLLRP
jgi:hypothetical protein